MSGIYIHIPFCSKACNYCNFHFSTSLKNKKPFLESIKKELFLRKNYLNKSIKTIYFGGGTPSLLTSTEINDLLDFIYLHYDVTPSPEITLEANPENLSKSYVLSLSKTKINRLSIGIQSFCNSILSILNRSHSSKESFSALKICSLYFENISIDFIFGIPTMTLSSCENFIKTIRYFDIKHISAYILTIEPNTVFYNKTIKKTFPTLNDKHIYEQFYFIKDTLTTILGFKHYELSNYAKPSYESKANSNYWKNSSYLGVGPSAHSYNLKKRSWNVSNNIKYIELLNNSILPSEEETLSFIDLYNEHIMTNLRTASGINLIYFKSVFNNTLYFYLLKNANPYIIKKQLFISNKTLKVTQNGWLLLNKITSDLFFVN